MGNRTAESIAKDKEKAILNAPSLYNYRLIARSVGVDEDTLIRWRNADKAFAEELDLARSVFIKSQMAKAKPEFLLERMEKDIFAPPKQETVTTTIDPVMILLQKFGVMEAIESERKTPESIQDSSQSGT